MTLGYLMRDQRPHAREPRAKITVAELAAELGRDLRRMYDLCDAQQVYARGTWGGIRSANRERARSGGDPPRWPLDAGALLGAGMLRAAPETTADIDHRAD